MSSSDPLCAAALSRRGVLALTLTGLAACGFTPVYGPAGVARGLTGQIVIDAPSDEAGYLLVRHLEERLGRASSAAPYRLSAAIVLREEGLGITPEREITRIRLIGTLDYTLSETGGDTVLQTGTVTNFTSYSAPVFNADRRSIAGNPVTIRAAERDAVSRLMTILADQVTARLLASAGGWRR